MSNNNKTINEVDALEGALSPIVNQLIDKNFENSGDKIASQIAPLIGGAIREQIKSQKDDIVDALYPVMGSMISKFVTKSLEELLSKINDQIQNGLSTNVIKRKIKAKIKGVSETELLLEENSEAHIKTVLLIHKDSGILLAKVQNEQETLNDTDMLASMMTAIRSFINDWVETNNTNNELGEIEYGGNKIIIEASGYSYLAVIVEGAAYAKTYTKIRNTLENIVLEYGKDIKKFTGDLQTLPNKALEKELNTLIDNESKTQKKKVHPLLFIFPLLFLAWLSYLFYQNYKDEALTKQVQTLLQKTPSLTSFKIDVDVNDGVTTLKGSVPFQYHKNEAQKLLKNIQETKDIHNDIIVIPTLTDPMQVSSNVAYLLRGVNLNNNTNLTYTFDYNTLTLRGIFQNYKIKKKVLQEIGKIQGIQTVQDETKIVTPPFKDLNIYFDTASSRLNSNTQAELLKTSKIIQTLDNNTTIELKAYSDMIGNINLNRELAKKRVQNIENFLKRQGALSNTIVSQIFETPPPGIDAQKEPKKARQIILTLQSKSK